MRRSVGTAGYGVGVRDVTVLYDADCAFCARLARRLGSREGVSLAPIRSPRGEEMLDDLPTSERDASLHVVDTEGRRRSAADALPGLARRFRGGRPLAWLLEQEMVMERDRKLVLGPGAERPEQREAFRDELRAYLGSAPR